MTITKTDTKQRDLGVVPLRTFTFAEREPFILENGAAIGPVTLAYETYGRLNASRSNAVLVFHALSGDAHAAGLSADGRRGWWDAMIGPGKAFDTERYYVICSNVLGGCQGSTGPSSIDPATGQPYGSRFPLISIGDMVKAQARLVRHLGIEKLLSVSGGSMGGMQALEWLVAYPEMVKSAIPISTSLNHSPQQIAFNEVGRQAIMADPNWKNGDYYGGAAPDGGLAIARMVGHITYMSEMSMASKFGRRFREGWQERKFRPGFEVESYLDHQGNSFVKRFDANAYLHITRAMDDYDATGGKRLGETFRGIDAQVLVIAFASDWLYPAYQTRDIIKACKLAGLDSTYCEIESSYGHDAFLLETEEETQLVRHFLERVGGGQPVEAESYEI
jgi:homoserine O-acetyltransferase